MLTRCPIHGDTIDESWCCHRCEAEASSNREASSILAGTALLAFLSMFALAVGLVIG